MVFRTSEIAASVALAATGECRRSLIVRATPRSAPKRCAMVFFISIECHRNSCGYTILLQLCSRKNIAAAVFKKKYYCSLNQVDIYSWEGDKDVLGSLLHFGTTSLWSINVWFTSAGIADLIQGPNMQSNERTMMMRASYPMSMPLLSGMSINLCLKLAFQLEETIFLGQVETPNNNCCQDLSS